MSGAPETGGREADRSAAPEARGSEADRSAAPEARGREADRSAAPEARGSEAGETAIPQAPFGRRRVPVVHAEALGPYRVLEVDDADAPPALPGQFHMVAAVERWGGGEDERPFLPRALAPAGGDGRLTFVLDVVGPGTARLDELVAGDEVWLTGPLGVSFTGPAPDRRAVLVAGGIGAPPIAAWQGRLREHGVEEVTLAGFRDAAHAQATRLMPGPVRLATDDGSAGHGGLVTELLIDELDADDRAVVYACGPSPMLEAIRTLCLAREVPTQLALESPMACGFGACFGCVVPLADGGYARTCIDGPVFDGALLAEVPA